MLGWMDREAMRRTLTEGRVTFWSRRGRSTGARATGCASPSSTRRTRPRCRTAPSAASRSDRDGTLWIGTDAGLARHARRAPSSPSACPRRPHCATSHELLAASDGSLWIATERPRAVPALRRPASRPGRPATGLASNRVMALAEDAAGQPSGWAAPGACSGGTARRCARRRSLRGQAARGGRSLAGRPGRHAVGGHRGGRPCTGSRRARCGPCPRRACRAAPIAALLVDRAGTLWVGSTGHGAAAAGARPALGAGRERTGWRGSTGDRPARGRRGQPLDWHGSRRAAPPQGRALHPLWPPGGAGARHGDGHPRGAGRQPLVRHLGRRRHPPAGRADDHLDDARGAPPGSGRAHRRGARRQPLVRHAQRASAAGRTGSFTSFSLGQSRACPRGLRAPVTRTRRARSGPAPDEGLARWNGERFEPFTPRGRAARQTDHPAAAASAAGGLWVGTVGRRAGLLLQEGQAVTLSPRRAR